MVYKWKAKGNCGRAAPVRYKLCLYTNLGDGLWPIPHCPVKDRYFYPHTTILWICCSEQA